MVDVTEDVGAWGKKGWKMHRGMRARVVGSIVGGTAWLAFVLLYVGFWATGLSLFQSIIVVLVSLVVLVGALGAIWASWGMRFAE